MKICIVTSSFKRFKGDYAGQHVYAQACGLTKWHDVYVIYPTDRDNPEKEQDPFHHLPFEYPYKTYPMAQVRGFDLLNTFKLFWRLRKAIHEAQRKNHIDLFYAFWTIPNAFICSLVCGKTPYIVNVAGSDDTVFGRGGIARPLVKRALNKASKVVSLSQDLKTDAIKMNTKDENISVIPSGININLYKPREKAKVRAELGLPDKCLITYVGSLFKLKRIDWLIRLSAILRKSHECQTLIIGDGPEKETLQSMAAELEANNILFLGHVAYEKVPQYISASNALVLFSETEGLPSVVQEALASGIPVVATDVGGVKDIVHQGMNGFVVNNEEEARICLMYMMESPEIVYHMGLMARKYAQGHLSHEYVFNKINETIQSVFEPYKKTKAGVAFKEAIDPASTVLKKNIGITTTFPPDFISYLVDVQAPYVQNIHVVAPQLNRKDVIFHSLKYDLSGNVLSQLVKQIQAQLRMAKEVLRLRHSVDFWIFLGGDIFILPIITARIIGKPVLLTLLGNLEFETSLKKNALNPFQLLIKKINCFLANRIIVYSRGLIEKWRLNHYDFKILIGQSLFVDLKKFKVVKPLLKRNKLIGYVGRLSPEKGIWNLLKSMPLVLKQDSDVRLMIIGNGPLHSSIREFLETDGLKDKVYMAGKIPFEQVPDWMNQLRLLVLPSLSEGLPAVILEAMACGTPVLATPVGAIDEVITSGKTGFLLEDNSDQAIADGILKALNDPEGESIAYAARELIEKEFSLPAAQRRYEKVIVEGNILSSRQNR